LTRILSPATINQASMMNLSIQLLKMCALSPRSTWHVAKQQYISQIVT